AARIGQVSPKWRSKTLFKTRRCPPALPSLPFHRAARNMFILAWGEAGRWARKPHFDMSAAPLVFNPDLQPAFEAELLPEAALVLCPKAELWVWVWRCKRLDVVGSAVITQPKVLVAPSAPSRRTRLPSRSGIVGVERCDEIGPIPDHFPREAPFVWAQGERIGRDLIVEVGKKPVGIEDELELAGMCCPVGEDGGLVEEFRRVRVLELVRPYRNVLTQEFVGRARCAGEQRVGDDRSHRLSRRRRRAVRQIVRIRAAGHDPVEQRNEKAALVEVGALNHRDPVEVVVAKGLLRRFRQCRRSHHNYPAERQFSGENRGYRRSL